ncbi:AP-3 complex subunit sigma-1 isoform X2 [Chiloscyllium plagiosum]|uniref:AP-3 complex subunit sigma-1 isoform X2 n=1 Tax=Chiloscyllium plagiosum TaxID=36176 RepID=UPI001CB86BC6|nr:AP-3 complex subunit sigma-1 isoform X2 [Chiloscyllium plagiosum]
MIKAILIFNNHGKPRLSKFYERYSEDTQQQIIRETFHLVSKRDENVCNFLEGGMLIGGADNKLIYRHYATLYFVFCVDSSESELGILDLIQVFVETLDKCFENVCELDLIFHVDKVHNILAEMVMGGMVLETNMNEIVTQIDAQNKMEKSEHPPSPHFLGDLPIFLPPSLSAQAKRGWHLLEAFPLPTLFPGEDQPSLSSQESSSSLMCTLMTALCTGQPGWSGRSSSQSCISSKEYESA